MLLDCGLSITTTVYLIIISHYINYIITCEGDCYWLTIESSDYITCTCHIAEVSGTTSHYYSDYSNEICHKLKATQTSKNIPFHLILFSVVFFYSNEHYFQSTFLHSKKLLVRLACICF